MRNVRMTICLVVVVLVMATGQGFGVIEFKDGGVHNIINSTIEDDVWVDWQAPGMQTTVNVGRDGRISKLYGFNDSRTELTVNFEMYYGGWVGTLYSYNNHQTTLNEGIVNTLYAYDNSQVNVDGRDSKIRTLYLHDKSQATTSASVDGIGDAYAYNNSHLIIANGHQGSYQTYDNSWVTITGGYSNEVSAYDNSQIRQTGGDTRLEAYNNSQAIITGGGEGYHYFHDNSQATITGASGEGRYDFGDSSHATITGGGGDFGFGGNSQAIITSGFVSHLYSVDNSQVTITGGVISGPLYFGGNSHINLSGGNISFTDGNDVENLDLQLFDSAILTINGSDFAIDGTPFSSGEITSILGGDWNNEPYRWLTGTLANGDIIKKQFRIGNSAEIVLTPEPATLLLLGLGAVMLRKKRR